MFDGVKDQHFITIVDDLYNSLVPFSADTEEALDMVYKFLISTKAYPSYLQGLFDIDPDDDDLDEFVVEEFRNKHLATLIMHYYGNCLETLFLLEELFGSTPNNLKAQLANITRFLEYSTTNLDTVISAFRKDATFAKDVIRTIISVNDNCLEDVTLNEALITYLGKWDTIYRLNPFYNPQSDVITLPQIEHDILESAKKFALQYSKNQKEARKNLDTFLKRHPEFITPLAHDFYVDHKFEETTTKEDQNYLSAIENNLMPLLIREYLQEDKLQQKLLDTAFKDSNNARKEKREKMLRLIPETHYSLRLTLAFYDIPRREKQYGRNE